VRDTTRQQAPQEGLRWRNEDLAAELEDCFRRAFPPMVRRAIRKHRLSLEDAEDIAQEAFLLAVLKLDSVVNPKLWLYHAVDRLSANLRKKRQRRVALAARWQGGGAEESDWAEAETAEVEDA